MTGAKIEIRTLKDKEDGIGAECLRGIDKDKVTESKDLTLVIMEGGMHSGATSVTVVIKNDDGTVTMAQTSAAIIRTFEAALRGAEKRFAEAKEKAQEDE
jgi:hypothetical protein